MRNYRITDFDKYGETVYGFSFGPMVVERCCSTQKGKTSYWVVHISTEKGSIEVISTGTGKISINRLSGSAKKFYDNIKKSNDG